MSKIGFLKRYIFIVNYVKRNEYCNIDELLHKLIDYLYQEGISNGASKRTITRDINIDIPSLFLIYIKYCPIKKGYYISENDSEYFGTNKILESFEIISSMSIEKKIPNFIMLRRRKSRGTEHLITLSKAIHKKKILTFKYMKFYPAIEEIRIVEPYILKESHGRWYLLGFDHEGDHRTTKTFGLDRMSSLDVSDNIYQPDLSIDWTERYKHCFAMFTDEQPQRVVFKLDHRDGSYVESMPIHHSQKIIKQSSCVVVELYIAITLDFIMELMSRSWSIEVIEPVSLREKIRQIYKEALERNL